MFIPLRTAPYTVQIEISIDETHIVFCGGSIISSFTILTAAHCTFEINNTDITVRVGSAFNFGGEIFKVAKIVNYPMFEPYNMSFDIALLHLRSPIKLLAQTKETVKLPKQNEIFADDTNVLVSGWGATQNLRETNKKLRAVLVPIVNQEKCKQSYPELTDMNLCAGIFDKGGKDSCQGKTEL